MAGLVPAIHALPRGTKNVDARAFASPKPLRPRRRDKPGHDDLLSMPAAYFPANSVGVRPVTWRNAAENAGTLA